MLVIDQADSGEQAQQAGTGAKDRVGYTSSGGPETEVGPHLWARISGKVVSVDQRQVK
jgi:hypothetical protein